jgi:hypothetical protein
MPLHEAHVSINNAQRRDPATPSTETIRMVLDLSHLTEQRRVNWLTQNSQALAAHLPCPGVFHSTTPICQRTH